MTVRMRGMNAAAGLARTARRAPAAEALWFEERSWSYAELDAAVADAAAALDAAGIRRGDRVALLGMNSDEYVVALLACSRLAAVSVPLNYRLHVDELGYLVADSGAVGLLVDAEFADAGQALATVIGNAVGEVRVHATLYGAVSGRPSLAEMRAVHAGAAAPVAEVAADDLDRILYTSGTTSRPKGVMLSHGNAAWNVLAQIGEGCLQPDERALAFAPLYHIGAQELAGLRVFAVGGAIVVMRRFDAKAVLEAVDRHRITGMAMVATMVNLMRELVEGATYDTTSLRWLVFGQVPEALFPDLRLLFPNAELKNSYGLTECCSSVTALDPEHQGSKPTSPGRPVLHVDVDIVDDDGRAVPAGELGEIVVRSPKVMLGYWNNAAATAETLRDGWLHTGDVGYLDDDGYLYVVDRKKDMIRSGGENVASQEIERVIHELDAVAECAVIAVPDPKWQEVPRAVVVRRAGATVTAAEVIAHCASRLGGFKVPRDVEFVDELPRNPSGKVLKRQLRPPT